MNTEYPFFQNESMPGFVYFIAPVKGERYVKIGRAADVDKRLRELSIATPHALEVLHVIPTDDSVLLESVFHSLFCAKRLGGEWFDLADADLDRVKGMTRFEFGIMAKTPAQVQEYIVALLDEESPSLSVFTHSSVNVALLTPKEAAALVGCSRSRIYDALAKGEIATAPNVEAAVKLLRARDVEAWWAKPKDKGGRPRVPRPQDSFPKRPRAANVKGRSKED